MSTFPAYPPYGTYQTPYPAYPSTHYPSQYPQNTPVAPFPPLYALQPKPPSAPRLPPAGPHIASISPEIASRAIQRLIVAQLRHSEFDSAEPRALQRFEYELVAFIQLIYERSHEYANLANRAIPIAKDMLLACEEQNLKTKDLHQVVEDFSNQNSEGAGVLKPPTLVLPLSRSPSPELLPSDDEGATPAIPMTLRTLPSYFPALPPKHTYLRTPASPPKKAALPSLEKKLKNAGLVQESLKNLLLATEDNIGQEDGELLGHIVNWEASTYPRKRWRVES